MPDLRRRCRSVGSPAGRTELPIGCAGSLWDGQLRRNRGAVPESAHRTPARRALAPRDVGIDVLVVRRQSLRGPSRSTAGNTITLASSWLTAGHGSAQLTDLPEGFLRNPGGVPVEDHPRSRTSSRAIWGIPRQCASRHDPMPLEVRATRQPFEDEPRPASRSRGVVVATSARSASAGAPAITTRIGPRRWTMPAVARP